MIANIVRAVMIFFCCCHVYMFFLLFQILFLSKNSTSFTTHTQPSLNFKNIFIYFCFLFLDLIFMIIDCYWLWTTAKINKKQKFFCSTRLFHNFTIFLGSNPEDMFVDSNQTHQVYMCWTQVMLKFLCFFSVYDKNVKHALNVMCLKMNFFLSLNCMLCLF